MLQIPETGIQKATSPPTPLHQPLEMEPTSDKDAIRRHDSATLWPKINNSDFTVITVIIALRLYSP